MGDIADQGDDWLRDFVTDGVEASGENDPEKIAGRTLFALIDALVYGIAKLNAATTAPSSPSFGTPWLDTTTDVLKLYDGAGWITLFAIDTAGHSATLTGAAAANGTAAGGAVAIAGAAGGATSGTGGAATVTGGTGGGTGNGAAAVITGGASGTGATGNGGAATLTGGAAASTNGNGGAVVLTPGAKAGTGKDAAIVLRGVVLTKQGAPTAKTDGATLTAAELLAGILTVNAADNAADSYQMPTASDLDAALPDAAAGDAFDFVVIDTNANAAADATLTTNTGWTLVGGMVVEANDADRAASSARFRARKTGSAAWTLYRIG